MEFLATSWRGLDLGNTLRTEGEAALLRDSMIRAGAWQLAKIVSDEVKKEVKETLLG